jgi:hypothetical protein
VRCAVCDQLLLKDDTVCWQCGSPVAPRGETSEVVAEPGWPVPRQERKLSQRSIYTALTIFVIGAALLVTAYLARQPRAEIDRSALPPGWVWVRGGSGQFTLMLPQRWEVVSTRREGQEDNLARLVDGSAELSSALKPLGDVDTSLRLIFYGHGPLVDVPWESGLVLVARSRNLNQLEDGEIAALARQLAEEMALDLDAAREVQSFERSYTYLSLTDQTEGAPRRCQQQIYPGQAEALLVVACARPDERFQETVNQILGSFQRLIP